MIITDLEAEEKSEFDEACRRPAPLLLLGTGQRGYAEREWGLKE